MGQIGSLTTTAMRRSYTVVERGLVALHSSVGIGNVGGPPRDAILMYHAVGEDPAAGYFGNVSTDRFRESIAYVSNNADIVPLFEIVRPGHERRVAITFDDGLKSCYTEALPIIEEYGIPVTVFINPAFIDDRNRNLALARHGIDDTGQVMLSEEQLVELIEHPLVTVGSHTLTHRNLASVDDEDERHAEIVESKHRLEDRYGSTTDLFSYPHGASCERSRAIVEETYEISVTTKPFLIGGDDSHHLPRVWAHKPRKEFRWDLSPAGDKLNRLHHRIANL